MPKATNTKHKSSVNARTHAPRSSADSAPPTPLSASSPPSSEGVYSGSIYGAADRLIQLFNAQISQEIQATCAHLKAEREKVLRERLEIKREREAMERERASWKGEGKFAEDISRASGRLKDEEIIRLRVENQALRVRIQALQVRLDRMEVG